MNHAAKTILSPGATVAVNQPCPVAVVEKPDSLFERFAWIYIFCREKVFRNDTGRIIRAFWPAGEPPASSKVLELGCGPGFYARALAQRFQRISVLGVDSSRELVKYARERATEKALHNCAFAWGDVLNLPQPDNSFSQLVTSRLFTILSERERAVGEIFRVLNSGGKCFVAAPRFALAIMTKAPRAGTVKTRLQPPLTPSEAAELNTCFLRDIAAVISAAGERSQGVGVFTPARSEKEYEGILPSHFDLIPQRGNGFGERLTNAADDLLHVGFESCCLINSDSPTATAEAFREAVAQLQDADDRIVLGPSDDGGYYLIGMRKLNRHLFEEIDWSTERVFAQTDERAREVGLKVHVLPKFYDVDDGATLRRLCEELLRGNSRDDIAPVTTKFLAELIAREGWERLCPQ